MPSHELRKGVYCKALRVNTTGRYLDQNYLSPCNAMWMYCSVCLCMYMCVQETELKVVMRACPLSCLLPLVAFKKSRRAFPLLSRLGKQSASDMALETDQKFGIIPQQKVEVFFLWWGQRLHPLGQLGAPVGHELDLNLAACRLICPYKDSFLDPIIYERRLLFPSSFLPTPLPGFKSYCCAI